MICHSRPCAFVACRYHLGIDVKASGSIIFNYDDPVGDGQYPTCALDLADKHELTLESVGTILGESTREWARKIEEAALNNIRADMTAANGGEHE
jgi:hypothetical protein